MPRSSIKKRLLIIAELMTGAILGAIFIAPKIDGDVFGGICIGITISGVFIYFTFPELRQSQQNIWDGKNKFDINTENYFTHPTQIPIWIGGAWFLVIALSAKALRSFFPAYILPNMPFSLLMLGPSLVAFGYSGYLMIKRKEMVGNFGHIYRGFWAYFNGVLLIIFGWGGLLAIMILYLLDTE